MCDLSQARFFVNRNSPMAKEFIIRRTPRYPRLHQVRHGDPFGIRLGGGDFIFLVAHFTFDRRRNPQPRVREHSNRMGFHLHAGKEKGWKYLQRKGAIPGSLSKRDRNWQLVATQSTSFRPVPASWRTNHGTPKTSDQVFLVSSRCIQSFLGSEGQQCI
jgi:hypothetical protein